MEAKSKDKKAKFDGWEYKSSYKTRPQVRVSQESYMILSKGRGSMAQQIDRLLGVDLLKS